jgi:hypothetical protein
VKDEGASSAPNGDIIGQIGSVREESERQVSEAARVGSD